VELVAEKLKAAVLEGFGKGFSDIDFDTPDYNMLLNLEKNIYQFSAAKNYQQLREMTSALVDENNVVRSFKEFRDIAQQINFQYNSDWLQTEYNTAINSATLASRWSDFEQNKDTMPLLEYVTAGDDRVREAHRALNHVKKPMDDPFWETYYPPNDYNCRCTVNQLTSGVETNMEKVAHPDINPLFRVNLAKRGLAFPPDHPYYDGVPASVIKKGIDLIKPKK
jgi:SPP1 gp7 family putative phage head morphogenesis protein